MFFTSNWTKFLLLPCLVLLTLCAVSYAQTTSVVIYAFSVASSAIANFSHVPPSGPLPLPATFTDASTATISNADWGFGDGGTTTAIRRTLTHTSNTLSIDTVMLTVSSPLNTSTRGASDYITTTFRLSQLVVSPSALDFGYVSTNAVSFGADTSSPILLHEIADPFIESTTPVSTLAVSFISGPTNGADPLTVAFSDDSSGVITNRLWDFGDGTTINCTVAPSLARTYNREIDPAAEIANGPYGSGANAKNSYISVTNTCLGIPWLQFDAFPTSGASTQSISQVAQLRPRWIQLTINWSEIEAVQGTFDFSVPDAQLGTNRRLTPYGRQVELRLASWCNAISSPWSTGGCYPGWFHSLTTNQQMAAYQVMVSNVCAHYAGQVKLLELDNEPCKDLPDETYEVMILSSCVNVARSRGISLLGGEFDNPDYGAFTNLVNMGVLNYCDWFGFHEYRLPTQSPDTIWSSSGLRSDQIYDKIGGFGKPMIVDEFQLNNSVNIISNNVYTDRTVKDMLMMRRSGVQVIDPYLWYNNAGSYNGIGCGSLVCFGGYSNGVITAVGQTILNLGSLLGNNSCATSSVQYPYYYYQFGTNAFAWIAEGSAPTGMALSGWSSAPTYVRNGSSAPSNVLSNSPIVLSGNGTIILINLPREATRYW